MATVDNDNLFDLLENVEICDMESGQYYRAIDVANESTSPVVTLARVD